MRPRPDELQAKLKLAEQCLDDGWSFNEIQRTHHISCYTLKKYFPGRGWTEAQTREYVSALLRSEQPGVPVKPKPESPKRVSRVGESNTRAKLTENQVREIRTLKETSKVLGQRFGVSESTIVQIRSGRTWGHVR